VFQRTVRRGTPLSALLEVMESLHEPSVRVLERLDAFFDPRRTPEAFVPFLATWVDLERLFDPRFGDLSASRPPIDTGVGRLRELTAAAASLSKWRGTTRGLLRFLETATGESDFEVVESAPGAEGRPRPFHVVVRAPASCANHRALIERIIDQEKPAYVTYELSIGAQKESARAEPDEESTTPRPPPQAEPARRKKRARARSKRSSGAKRRVPPARRDRKSGSLDYRSGRRRPQLDQSIDPTPPGTLKQRRF
jgi:phage tail-like protein